MYSPQLYTFRVSVPEAAGFSEAAPAEPGAEEEQDAPSAESEERPEAERIAVSAGCE